MDLFHSLIVIQILHCRLNESGERSIGKLSELGLCFSNNHPSSSKEGMVSHYRCLKEHSVWCKIYIFIFFTLSQRAFTDINAQQHLVYGAKIYVRKKSEQWQNFWIGGILFLRKQLGKEFSRFLYKLPGFYRGHHWLEFGKGGVSFIQGFS